MKQTLDKIINTAESLTNNIININKKASTLLTNDQYDELINRVTHIQDILTPPQPQKIVFRTVIRGARIFYNYGILIVNWSSFIQCYISAIFHDTKYTDDDPEQTIISEGYSESLNLKEYTVTLSNNSTIKVTTSGTVSTSNPVGNSLMVKIYNADTNQLIATPIFYEDVFWCLPNTNYRIQYIAQ